MKYRKMIPLLILAALLGGCGQAKEPENPCRLKTQILERYLQDETQTTRTEYVYNENGWLVETQTFQDDAWWYTTKFTLDEKGNSLGSEKVAADGTVMKEVMVTTDNQGRMLTSESYLNGELEKSTEYGYNQDGQITKRYTTTIDPSGGENRISCIDNTYDRDGNLIRTDVRYEPGSETGYSLCIYEKGQLIREESYVEDRLDQYKEYTFGKTGLVQTALTKKEKNFVQSKHITTFDEYGNPLEILAFAYGSEFARLGKAEEDPDSRTTFVYEIIP